jgi:hypothetical protein
MMYQKDFWDILQIIAVVVTLGVLIKYTWETWKLRKESAKQNELNILPCISVSFAKNRPLFIVMKVGRGPAFNIEFNPIKTETGSTYNIVPIDLLCAGEPAVGPMPRLTPQHYLVLVKVFARDNCRIS